MNIKISEVLTQVLKFEFKLHCLFVNYFYDYKQHFVNDI